MPIRPDWHAETLKPITVPASTDFVPPTVLDQAHKYALSLLQAENAAYTSQSQASSSHNFMSTIMSSGTWNDKVSALTLVVQESPLHTMKPLESLIGLAAKRTRSQALLALGALKDLFCQGVILPSDRKLRVFNKQPELWAAFQGVKTWADYEALPGQLTNKHLMTWAYEDWLKKQYFEILKVLESWCNDEVEFAKLQAVTFVYEMLKEKPEQEENLLRLLVNKLGDTSRKVASRTSYLLLQLENSHPSMKVIIVNNIETDILLRPGQSSHAKYYAVITLNQTILQTSAPDVANKLLDIYFSLFVSSLNRSRQNKPTPSGEEDKTPVDPEFVPSKKRKRLTPAEEVNKAAQELEDKIIAQVLSGINRAFPFTSKDSAVLEKHLDTMYRITHSANFNTSIQALLLIQQISTAHHISTDRFMRTLYESLLDPRLIRSSKQTMYLNLLYRALKNDVSVRRIKAFIKRLLQVITLHDPAFVCSVLYLIVELQNIFPGVKAMLDQPETQDDDDEEVFADAPEAPVSDENENALTTTHPSRLSNLEPIQPTAPSTAYDGRKRDPEHSNADRTCLWDLPTWSHHYHPSVTVFATHLLSNSTLRTTKTSAPPPKPDPSTHTLIHFLDRFVYRNPKQKVDANLRGSSLMQPALASTNTTDSLVRGLSSSGKDGAVGAAPLNTEAFWARRVEDVAPDQVFFHKYFAEVGPRKSARAEKKKKKGDEDDEDDEEGDGGLDEDEKRIGVEDEIWKALVGSNKELEDGADVDEDDEDDDDVLEMAEDSDDLLSLDDDAVSDVDEDEDDNGVDVEGLGDVDFEDGLLDELQTAGDFGSEEEEPKSLFPEEEEEKPRKGKKKLPGKDAPDLESKRSKKRKRTLKSLPMFADVEEYEKMLGDDEEGLDE